MGTLRKPKIFQDVKSKGATVFENRPGRLNLGYYPTIRVPLTRFVKTVVVAVSVASFLLGSAVAPTTNTSLAAKSEVDAKSERAQLEAQLRELEGQIDQYEDQIVGYQKQGKSLTGEIKVLNDKIAKLNLQIRAINLSLGQLDQQIGDTREKITITEGTLEEHREALGTLLRNMYTTERTSAIEIFLKNPKISDFFNDLNGINLVQSDVRVAITRISDLRTQLKDHHEQLALRRADTATLKAYQDAQKKQTDILKKEKGTLLEVTKGQETKYQTLLKETKQTADQIRKRIFQLLGGGQLSFEDAYKYAKMASDATGVRPALILAVLDRESALGRNVGRCNYKTAMNPKDHKYFLELTAELKINPDTIMVSCPNSDGVYGGAMGPAQFIPSTWRAYKDAVGKVTGSKPASPWNNSDAFVATGLFMKDLGAFGSIANERKAAAKYYAGGNWSRHLWTYGEAVVTRAEQFEEDIKTINP
jgi:membrane-bound lytic murein transglycosylase B